MNKDTKKRLILMLILILITIIYINFNTEIINFIKTTTFFSIINLNTIYKLLILILLIRINIKLK